MQRTPKKTAKGASNTQADSSIAVDKVIATLNESGKALSQSLQEIDTAGQAVPDARQNLQNGFRKLEDRFDGLVNKHQRIIETLHKTKTVDAGALHELKELHDSLADAALATRAIINPNHPALNNPKDTGMQVEAKSGRIAYGAAQKLENILGNKLNVKPVNAQIEAAKSNRNLRKDQSNDQSRYADPDTLKELARSYKEGYNPLTTQQESGMPYYQVTPQGNMAKSGKTPT